MERKMALLWTGKFLDLYILLSEFNEQARQNPKYKKLIFNCERIIEDNLKKADEQ